MSSNQKPKATRQAFGEVLAELGTKHTNLVVFDADLAKSTKSEMFAKKFPDRFYEMGIAEANMIGTAAGMAMQGFVPFICSFGCFVTGRFDQIRMSVAYAGANVRVIGTHAGVGIGDDGHSQMGLEDLSLMRGLPTMTVLQPCDELETRQMIEFLMTHDAPAYVRLTRQNLIPVHDGEYRFRLGRVDVLRESATANVAILATGATVQECVRAHEILQKQGVQITLANVPTIKPLNSDDILDIAKGHRWLLTVEDHYTIGGLGSAVAEIISDRSGPTRLVRLGVNDQFGASGEPIELYDKFGISAAKIVQTVSGLLNS